MNHQKLLLIIIFFSIILIFILGSYLTSHSAVTIFNKISPSFQLKARTEIWPSIQNFSWSIPKADDNEAHDTKTKPEAANTRQATGLAGSRQDSKYKKSQKTEVSDAQKFVQKSHGAENPSKKKDAAAKEVIFRIFANMDEELRDQYLIQVKKFESEHSTQINQLPVSMQRNFLEKFLKAAGYYQKLPDVINIGVKKSGTNALGFFIAHHPLISHSLGNEVHFFDWNYQKGLKFYRSKMGFTSKFQLSFEKTPRYFVTDSAPANILKDLGNSTKFVLCFRDPIDRLVSDFRHETELRLRKEWIKSGKKKMNSSPEKEGKKLEKLLIDKKGNINVSSDFIRTSSYSIHLKNWLKYFPLDNFIFLDHDRLLQDTFSVMKEVESFLDLKEFFRKDMFYFDPTRGGPCMHTDGKPCPSKSTPGFMPKAKLSKAVQAKLRVYFRPLLQELLNITGKRFPWSHSYL